MKKNSLILFSIAASLFLLISCDKNESSVPKLYSSYLSVELSSYDENLVDPIYEVCIINSSGSEFEEECTLFFRIYDENKQELTHAEEKIVNKRYPEDVLHEFLNIQSGKDYLYTTTLNDLNWTDNVFNLLEKGEYILQTSIFINDPASPNNIIESNKLFYK